MVRVDELALLGMRLNNRGKGGQQIAVGTFTSRVELPGDGTLCRATLWVGGLPAALTALFECILERRGKAGKGVRGEWLIALDLLDEVDNVVDGGGDFVDHGAGARRTKMVMQECQSGFARVENEGLCGLEYGKEITRKRDAKWIDVKRKLERARERERARGAVVSRRRGRWRRGKMGFGVDDALLGRWW